MGLRGSILGDIAGSRFEFIPMRDPADDPNTVDLFTDDSFFTDDTVLSIATKVAIIQNNVSPNFKDIYQLYGNAYPERGYGDWFQEWLNSINPTPYGSAGNGAAMRVSFIGEYYDKIRQVHKYAIDSASCTHNTKSAILGAVTTACSNWLAKHHKDKDELMYYWKRVYSEDADTQYPITMSLDEMRKKYHWTSLAKDTIPLAFRCVYEATDYEDFLRKVLSFPCDADTTAAIGGGIAEELFGFGDLPSEQLLQKYLNPTLYFQIM